MKKIAVAAVIAAVIASPGVLADDAEYREQCKKYAQEEGVPAEEMKQYIKDCVSDLKGSESESESAEESSGGSGQE